MVYFRTEWCGLKGRKLGDPERPFLSIRSGTAIDDGRFLTRTMPAASLTSGWPKLTASILAPVMRMFGVDQTISEQDVREWSEKFRAL